MTMDWRTYLDAIENEIQRIVADHAADVAPLYDMMAYHLGWLDESFHPVPASRGKRLRPLICALSCEAAGGDWHRALPAAASLELVHNFSLIHDDIEDNSATRRGRRTVWSRWGPAHGINTGDAMLSLARRAMALLMERGVDSSTTLTAMLRLDAILAQLCEGQYLDISGEGQLELSEAWYMRMIGGKTAALLAGSAELGALVAQAHDRLNHFRDFGWYLGLAFQMVDDILGIWGDPANTGKSAASDIESRKMTLPVIVAMRSGDEGERLASLYRQAHLNPQDVQNAMAILEHAGARHYVQQMAITYERQALEALMLSGATDPAAEHLRSLTAALTSRRT